MADKEQEKYSKVYFERGIEIQEIDARYLSEGLLQTTRLIDRHQHFVILLSHYNDVLGEGHAFDYTRLSELIGVEIELAEKKDLRFVSVGGVAPSDIKVGDYIWGNETSADKVESIDEDEDNFLFRCGSECVAKVITNPELAKELLPTQAGFFFGDTDYTEYYIYDLKEYIRQADEIIADYENEIANGTDKYDLDYTYQASW